MERERLRASHMGDLSRLPDHASDREVVDPDCVVAFGIEPRLARLRRVDRGDAESDLAGLVEVRMGVAIRGNEKSHASGACVGLLYYVSYRELHGRLVF